MGIRKSFGTHITKIHLDNLSAMFLVGQWIKCAKKANIWPQMPVLGKIWPFFGQKLKFGGEGVILLVSSYQGTNKTHIRVETIDRCGSNWPLGTRMCNFDPKIWIFWAINKMTHNDNRPGPGWNYREMAVFKFSRKVVFWTKCVLSQKTPNIF